MTVLKRCINTAMLAVQTPCLANKSKITKKQKNKKKQKKQKKTKKQHEQRVRGWAKRVESKVESCSFIHAQSS